MDTAFEEVQSGTVLAACLVPSVGACIASNCTFPSRCARGRVKASRSESVTRELTRSRDDSRWTVTHNPPRCLVAKPRLRRLVKKNQIEILPMKFPIGESPFSPEPAPTRPHFTTVQTGLPTTPKTQRSAHQRFLIQAIDE